MAKYTRNNVSSGYTTSEINNELEKIESAINGQYDRQGGSGNQLEGDMDINDNHILNAASVRAGKFYIGGELVQKGERLPIVEQSPHPDFNSAIIDTNLLIGDKGSVAGAGDFEIVSSNPDSRYIASANGYLKPLSMHPTLFGADTSNADNTSALQAFGDEVGEGLMDLFGGTYKILSPLNFTKSLELVNGTIDASGAGFVGAHAIKFEGGGFTQIEELNSDVSLGASTITLASAPSLSANDVFVIYNPTDSSWSGFRPVYRAGEWCEAVGISSNNVTLVRPLYDSYVVADVDLYKLAHISPKVDINILGGNGSTGIHFKYCKDFYFKGNVTNKNNSLVLIDKCFGGEAYVSGSNAGDGGDDYGVSIANSDSINIYAGNIYARRHPVAMGGDAEIGAVPCRNIRVRNGTLSNDFTTGVHSADFHGNCEDCSYENVAINGGATFQGKNNGYKNCRITNAQNGSCILSAEILGGLFYLDECNLTTYANPLDNGRGVVDLGGNSSVLTSNTVEDVTIRIKGCKYKGVNQGGGSYFCLFENDGTNAKINIDIRGVTGSADAMAGMLSTRLNSGTADSDYFIVDDIAISGVTGAFIVLHISAPYSAFKHRLQKQTGSEELTTSTSSSTVAGTAVTFNWVYHKEPVVTVGKTDAAYLGDKLGHAYANPVTTTGLTPAISSHDGTNFSAVASCDVNWAAEITEI